MKELNVLPFNTGASGVVSVPGSKSITNRALLMAALAEGDSIIREALESDDTRFFSKCLNQLGYRVDHDSEQCIFRVGSQDFAAPELASLKELWVGNAGTAARFLLPLAVMNKGMVRFDGVPAMRKRPMIDLINVLEAQGASAQYEQEKGFFPVTIEGEGLAGGRFRLEATKSSQQVSALMMIAPMAKSETTIELTGDVVSQPYIDMTASMMRQWGAEVDQVSQREIRVSSRHYRAQEYTVEPDASSASYFFAAAAATGGTVGVKNISRKALQGDVAFVDVLEKMGCIITEENDTLFVSGPETLKGLEVDMNAISDTAPTLAAIASRADSPVTIKNVEHMRWKETDRIEAMASEIRRCGGRVETFKDGMTIYPSTLECVAVDTYEDHRIAMSMAIAGIANNGMVIKDPDCVGKTFSTFFDVLENLRKQSVG